MANEDDELKVGSPVDHAAGVPAVVRSLRMLNDHVKPAIKCREITGDDHMAKVSIVGLGMRSHAGIAAKMFRTLADNGINLRMISTSPIKISCMITKSEMATAVRALHDAFQLDREPMEEEAVRA